jgi:GH25 family lysozyme M1 (1,4-beta-N-acetylmuramidase)
MELGIDVSYYETWSNEHKCYVPMNWEMAKSRGIRWASIRASAGTNQDFAFVDNVRDAGIAGIKRLPYHWYDPRRGTVQAQIDTFRNVAMVGEMPPMLDLEDTKTRKAWRGIGSDLRIWLETIRDSFKKTPIVYSNPAYVKSYFTPRDTWLREYPLFVAHWQVVAPLVLLPWTPFDLAGWQFTTNAWAPDYGVMNGGKEAALALWY